MHLQQNWITDREAINKYLEQYDSWKNAKKEWKDNTLNNLTNMIKEQNKNDKTQNNSDIKKEENKWENKTNDKENKSVKIDNVKVRKPGGNWLPDMDSSINWIEEEVDENLIYDKNWNPIWSKAKTNTKYSSKEEEAAAKEKKKNDNASKYNKDEQKETKKKNKKESVKNALKNSPTITWLLKAKKKK